MEDNVTEDHTKQSGPDLMQGVALAQLDDGGMLIGHVGDEEVLLVRRGTEIFAIGAHCTHYHGPLAEGLAHLAAVEDGGRARPGRARPERA